MYAAAERGNFIVVQRNLSLANRLISALPDSGRARFLQQCDLVELTLHSSVAGPGCALSYAYFPVDSFVSVVLPAPSAPDIELGMVGNEGMFSTSLILGVHTSAFKHVVQGAGRAFRIGSAGLQRALVEDSCLQQQLHRYVDVRGRQLAQQLACGSYHNAEQRFARLLLATRDRAQCSELFMTHEVWALMLGVRRETISRVAGDFQSRGLISYSRGYVLLLDEPGLAGIACHCYQSDLLVYEQAFAGDACAQACQTPKPASLKAMPSSTSISRAPS